MTIQWKNVSTNGILRHEFVRDIQWANVPAVSLTPTYYCNSIHSRSSSESLSSSSSWMSSQESLNLYGSSPERPRTIGLKPEDRLRRIRENFIHERLNKMEVDEEEEFKHQIHATKQATTECSSMTQINDYLQNPNVMESVHSVSLRFKRFRESRTNQNKTARSKIDIYKLLPLRPWERETPATNKLRRPHSYVQKENNIRSSYNRENTPRWMMPLIPMNSLRRPKILSQ